MKVAVVYNENNEKVLKLRRVITRERYERNTIERIALKNGGHEVDILDGNMDFVREIVPYVEREGVDNTIVFNLAYGIQGEGRYSHIPGILELLGVMYTGSGPLGHSLALDKVATKLMFQSCDVPTPEFWVVSRMEDLPDSLPSRGEAEDGSPFPWALICGKRRGAEACR